MSEYGSVPHQPNIADREKGKLYANRDVIAQGEFYLRHIHHMTAEGLHSKVDIAAELAHRDARIAELESENKAIETSLVGLSQLLSDRREESVREEVRRDARIAELEAEAESLREEINRLISEEADRG